MKRCSATLLPLLLLAACAAPQGDYPTLAVRDAERVSGSFTPPAPTPLPPAAVAPATLAELEEAARTSHAAFTAALPQARALAAAARGAAPDAPGWGEAQGSLASLESHRAAALIALANLDRFYVDALTAGEDASAIAAARDAVLALVAQQEREVTAVARLLGS